MIYENWDTCVSGECAVIGRNVGYQWVFKSCNEQFGFLCETSTVPKTDEKAMSLTGKYSTGFIVVNLSFARTIS